MAYRFYSNKFGKHNNFKSRKILELLKDNKIDKDPGTHQDHGHKGLEQCRGVIAYVVFTITVMGRFHHSGYTSDFNRDLDTKILNILFFIVSSKVLNCHHDAL